MDPSNKKKEMNKISDFFWGTCRMNLIFFLEQHNFFSKICICSFYQIKLLLFVYEIREISLSTSNK
jgi:hypothetical protein